MATRISLRGMTWDHSRGFGLMAATAQWCYELPQEVEITWDKRSLQEFEDKPIADLAAHRLAWTDGSVNSSCSHYVHDTLPTLDLDFQDQVGDPTHAFLREGGDPTKVLETLNRLYRESYLS